MDSQEPWKDTKIWQNTILSNYMSWFLVSIHNVFWDCRVFEGMKMLGIDYLDSVSSWWNLDIRNPASKPMREKYIWFKYLVAKIIFDNS